MTEISRVIFHVDIDAFYPSVEIRENQKLRGRPVIVGSDPKNGRGRGVVVSCSYEARMLGVTSGQPISRAFRISPNAVYIRPNFPLYTKVSRNVMELLRKHADRFEQVSIDEAFLDVSERVKFEEAGALALEIKREVEEREGLTCSVGVAPNKSSAKIASEYQKPDGLTVVLPENLRNFLAPLPASSITGIGKKTDAYLETLGVKTIGDLQLMKGKDLVKKFGKTGVWLWGVANGLERIEVKEKTAHSLSAECTFDEDIFDRQVVLEKLDELAQRLHKRVVSLNVKFKVVRIKVRFTHFDTYSREKTIAVGTTSKEVIIREAENLFREFKANQKAIRLIGLSVSGFSTNDVGVDLESWVQ